MVGLRLLTNFLLSTACVFLFTGAAAAQLLNFDIPAGELKTALDAYATQSNQQIIYETNVVRNKRSFGVHGALPAEQALQNVLAGTGLEIQRDASGAVAVREASPENPPAKAPRKGPSNSGGGGASEVESIIVTAQRRAEDVLAIPLSIQAMTGEQLRESGLKSLTELQLTTPGYLPTSGSGYEQIFIRGVGNAIFFGADPSVATFIDDVPRIWGTMVSNFVNVERVEIIKGAPGGLYGRNATGGAINIITRQPSTETVFGGARISYGEKNTFQAAAYVNVPIGDKVAVFISGQRDSHSPYVRNIATNPAPYTAAMFPGGSVLGTAQQTANVLNSGLRRPKGYGNQNFWTTDNKVLIKPSDNFKITFAGDYNSKIDSNGNQLYNLTPEVAQANLTGTLNAILRTNAQLPAGFLTGAQGKFTTSMGTDAPANLEDYGASATAVLNLSGVDLTSITAYRQQMFENIADLAKTSVPNVFVHGHVLKRYFYQEVRAASTDTGPFRLFGGATYLRNYFKSRIDVNLLPPVVLNSLLSLTTDHVTAWSVYAQMDYAFLENFNVAVSGRYIHEKNKGTYRVPTAPDYNAVEKRFLPAVTLSYKFPDGGNAYARWARGFKSGGVNPISPPSIFPNPALGGTFAGETIDTYEAGYRARLFDRRVEFTSAVFYNDYKNLQTQGRTNVAHSNIILAIVNAGSARTWGAEGSLTWRVSDPLTLGLTAGYLNAKFKNFAVTDTTVYVPFNLSGATMFNSPKLQLSFAGNFDQPISDSYRIVANAIVSHVSKVIWGVSGLPGVLPTPTGPGYWLTNLRIGFRTSDDKYQLSVYANNLFNTVYTTSGSSSAAAGTLSLWGNPRIVGAELAVKF